MNTSLVASLPVFATVLLGGFRNEEELSRTLQNSAKKVSFPAKALLQDEDFKCTPYEVYSVEIALVLVTPEMFGYKHFTGYKMFSESIQKAGLTLCPRDTGPVHFLRNEKPLTVERIFYGSRPIGQKCAIFSARKWHETNVLYASHVEEMKPPSVSPQDKFLFVRP